MRDESEKKNPIKKIMKPKEIIMKRMGTRLKKKQKSDMKLKRKSIRRRVKSKININ
jgi:hypothetical protein